MADPVCFPSTLNMNLVNSGSCCVQIDAAQDITLNQVYGSQVYWNSALEVECYGCTTATYFYSQFHFYCERGSNDEQVFRLLWCFDETIRGCSPCSGAGKLTFDLVSSQCDPLIVLFHINTDPTPCCYAADDCDPPAPIFCDFYATITE